jgi:iron(III) transport system ATP-binding protein
MPNPASGTILRLDHVTRQFNTDAPPAVSEVSLTMQAGDVLSLLGPSGCGKTTLLRLIAGFEAPQSGTVEIAQQQVAGASWVPPEKRGVGMVFQDYALFPHLTVAQNIGFGLKGRNGGANSSQRIQETMALVGLQGLAERFPHQLSGGQQQRVALARALAPQPFLVLLDEPLSNLDVQVRLRLRQELRDILKAAGTSAVFVTHDQEEALSISDTVAVMRQGRLEQIGSSETLYREPASRFVADFVTQANFLAAHRQGDIWQTALGAIPSARLLPSPDLKPLETLTQLHLMLRQEDLTLQPAAETAHHNAVIHDRQFLGREYRYSLQLAAGLSLVARTPVDICLPIGTAIQLSIADTVMLRAFPA